MAVISLEFNELNFDLVKRYVEENELPTFKKVLECYKLRITEAEGRYELLEPWIQWPTVYSGLTFAEHKVFRLGDIVNSDHPQIFEEVETGTGRPVVAVSPMNAVNRVSDESFFIPDPWTDTKPSAHRESVQLSEIVSRLVNGNSHGLDIRWSDLLTISMVVVRNFDVRLVAKMIKVGALAARKKWARPFLLDLLLACVFFRKYRQMRPELGSLFLNAGAHTQHHYLFSSACYDGVSTNPSWFVDPKDDPVLEVYRVYDCILSVALACIDKGSTLFITTGLSQLPNLKSIHYYRPKHHESLIRKLVGLEGIVKVEPRMSRDFLVTCLDEHCAKTLVDKLSAVTVSDSECPLFTLDLRGSTIFCKVAYHEEAQQGLRVNWGNSTESFHDLFSHVTIENGIHRAQGYSLRSDIPSEGQDFEHIALTQVHRELRDLCLA